MHLSPPKNRFVISWNSSDVREMSRSLWRVGRSPILLVVAYLLLAGTYSVVNPLFEAPDEIWHYEYVRWLAEGRGLPAPEDVGTAPWAQEGSQPPLYYLLGAALTSAIPTDNAGAAIRYNPHAAVGDADAFGNRNMLVHGPAHAWPWQGVALAAHLTRFLSILLGAVTVICTFFTAAWVWPRTPWAGHPGRRARRLQPAVPLHQRLHQQRQPGDRRRRGDDLPPGLPAGTDEGARRPAAFAALVVAAGLARAAPGHRRAEQAERAAAGGAGPVHPGRDRRPPPGRVARRCSGCCWWQASWR